MHRLATGFFVLLKMCSCLKILTVYQEPLSTYSHIRLSAYDGFLFARLNLANVLISIAKKVFQ